MYTKLMSKVAIGQLLIADIIAYLVLLELIKFRVS